MTYKTIEGELGVKVRALEWGQNWPADPLTAFAISTVSNRAYTVEHDGPRFYVSTRIWPGGDDEGIANVDDFEKAKAAAQEHYSTAILSAIEPSPITGDARIAELERVLNVDLNVTNEELTRIRNSAQRDGDVKIWAKMLGKIVDAIRDARASLTQNTETR